MRVVVLDQFLRNLVDSSVLGHVFIVYWMAMPHVHQRRRLYVSALGMLRILVRNDLLVPAERFTRCLGCFDGINRYVLVISGLGLDARTYDCLLLLFVLLVVGLEKILVNVGDLGLC